MSELKPCPFCGSKAEIIEIEPHTHMIAGIVPDCEGEAFVECTCCGAVIGARTAEEVSAIWNRRV